MVWLKLDDQIAHHPKFMAAGPLASWLWVCGNGYCNKYLTDGFIPTSALPTLGAVPHAIAVAQRLVAAGLWEVVADGFRVHDFLDYNPSAVDVKANRQWDRTRKELYADPVLLANIRARDGDQCRYCGRAVSWKDRRGERGGQYDHVTPRGDNTLDNVVTACRGCNNRKGSRTPAEAGMALLTPKSDLVPTQVFSSPVHMSPDPSRPVLEVRTHTQGEKIGGGALAGSLPRDHLRHAVCGRCCLPDSLFAELLRKVGGDEATSRTRVTGWARAVLSEWDGPRAEHPIQGDAFQWWRARWQEFQGLPQAASAWRPTAAIPWECPHVPPCPHRAACLIVALRTAPVGGDGEL